MLRSNFLKTLAALAGGSLLPSPSFGINRGQHGHSANGLLVISSGNGLPATERAMEMLRGGSDALDAVIQGVGRVESDPKDITVGYGGLPNEEGEVELDASCMHGPTHNAGSVGALKNIRHPAQVARMVMERSDHELLVGRGALHFARAHGFKEENLLTERARKIWLRYKENLSDKDDWLPKEAKTSLDEMGMLDTGRGHRPTGTITCMGIDNNGNISGTTTTSGLFFKIPGRVGDSPIIGAGLYVDNEVGACGSTGRGEANLKNLTCRMTVEYMRRGMSPEKACLESCKQIVDHNHLPMLRTKNGRPNFNVNFYALNKEGTYGCASIYGPVKYAVHDGQQNQHLEGAYLYPKSERP